MTDQLCHAEAQEQAAYNAALRDTIRALTSTLNLDEVLDRIFANIDRVVPYDSANVMLIDEATGTWRLVRWSGCIADHASPELLSEIAFDIANTRNLRQVTETQQPVIVPDTRTYDGWVDLAVLRWIRANLSAPICSKGQVLGALLLDSATPHFFTPEHAERLMAFADQAAIAIENARLYAAMQKARDEAEAANRAKSAFLATMSHEIRTPLNAVLGMATLLLDTPVSEEQAEYIRTIQTSGDALLAVINDVLDFSKIESGCLELEVRPLDVRASIRSALDLLAHRAGLQGLSLEWSVADDVPPLILGDSGRLRQVLINLLSNAVKFTEQGGVTVTADLQAPAQGPGEPMTLHFAVRDTGIGIPPQQIPHLFQSFSQLDISRTRRYGGTGLGLAICRRLTELMGGQLWVESKPQEGSTFHFTLAVCAPAAGSLPRPEHEPCARLELRELVSIHPCQILIVEDNIVNQKVAQRLLGRMGYRADVAATGREAIAALQTHAYDVLLMDLHMPEMDGLEATRIIRRSLPPERQPVVVAMTAAALVEDQAASKAAGMDAFITKPVRMEQLIDVLRSVCRDRTHQGEQSEE